ncbi:ribosomal protein S18 acetylase RimI-like enzyme [Flavobacterium sp. 123]|nr:ribosomal protein S18 acetylase RimI-like enzyme [Flavobacterium sp. 123]
MFNNGIDKSNYLPFYLCIFEHKNKRKAHCMNTIAIKKVSLSDLEPLQSICKTTFVETFADLNTPENIENYLHENFSVAQLSSEINNPNSDFYLAFSESEPIGYLKINFKDAQTEDITDNSLEIQRIYVAQAFHGKKMGQLLLDNVFTIAKQTAIDYIWLGVWEENHRAIQFYTKNGFEVFDKHLFILGVDEQTDLLMRFKL